MENIIIEKDGLELTLCPPDLQEGYYIPIYAYKVMRF